MASCQPSHRTISGALSSPAPAAKHTPFRWAALLPLEPVPLVTKALDLRQHSLQQELSRCSRYAGALKLENFLSLSSDLGAHVLDFGTDVVQTHNAPSILSGLFERAPRRGVRTGRKGEACNRAVLVWNTQDYCPSISIA